MKRDPFRPQAKGIVAPDMHYQIAPDLQRALLQSNQFICLDLPQHCKQIVKKMVTAASLSGNETNKFRAGVYPATAPHPAIPARALAR